MVRCVKAVEASALFMRVQAVYGGFKMKIFLKDIQRWFNVTPEEMKMILNANLAEYTRAAIWPFLLY